MKPQPWDPVPHWLYSHIYDTRGDLMQAVARVLMFKDYGESASSLLGTEAEAWEALRAALDTAKATVTPPKDGPMQMEGSLK